MGMEFDMDGSFMDIFDVDVLEIDEVDNVVFMLV